MDFDQVRIEQPSSEFASPDVARHAENIIATNRALRVAATVCAKDGDDPNNGRDSARIVAAYGQSLKGPLAWIIRQPILFDAEVLPFDKQTIQSALVDCARQPSLSDDDLTALGDLHFYLSYFIVGMNERENEPGRDFFAEQRAEGDALRSEWQRAVANSKPSKFSELLASWLKPNA